MSSSCQRNVPKCKKKIKIIGSTFSCGCWGLSLSPYIALFCTLALHQVPILFACWLVEFLVHVSPVWRIPGDQKCGWVGFCREQPRTAPCSNTALNSLSYSRYNYSPKIARQEWEFIQIFVGLCVEGRESLWGGFSQSHFAFRSRCLFLCITPRPARLAWPRSWRRRSRSGSRRGSASSSTCPRESTTPAETAPRRRSESKSPREGMWLLPCFGMLPWETWPCHAGFVLFSGTIMSLFFKIKPCRRVMWGVASLPGAGGWNPVGSKVPLTQTTPCIWGSFLYLTQGYSSQYLQILKASRSRYYTVFNFQVGNNSLNILFFPPDVSFVWWTLFMGTLSDFCRACTFTTWTV